MKGQPDNNVARDNIMRVLYKIHKSSRSVNAIAKGTKELYAAIKEGHDYKGSLISHHLDYLVQKGWVTEETSTSTFTKDGILIPQIKKKYKISVLGIEKYEDGSAFHHIKNNSSINITSINSVIVAGNGNVVNANYSQLSQKLDDLQTAISESKEISDELKLNVQADISTIQNQLSKTEPNKGIIKSAWAGIQAVSTISGVISAYKQIEKLILAFLSRV